MIDANVARSDLTANPHQIGVDSDGLLLFLTPTLKVKRKFITETNKALLDSRYR